MLPAVPLRGEVPGMIFGFIRKKWVVVGRKITIEGPQWWCCSFFSQARASVACAELNEDAMLDDSKWYFSVVRSQKVAEWMQRVGEHETRNRRRLQNRQV